MDVILLYPSVSCMHFYRSSHLFMGKMIIYTIKIVKKGYQEEYDKWNRLTINQQFHQFSSMAPFTISICNG